MVSYKHKNVVIFFYLHGVKSPVLVGVHSMELVKDIKLIFYSEHFYFKNYGRSSWYSILKYEY